MRRGSSRAVVEYLEGGEVIKYHTVLETRAEASDVT